MGNRETAPRTTQFPNTAITPPFRSAHGWLVILDHSTFWAAA
jgi:hypothetical protein